MALTIYVGNHFGWQVHTNEEHNKTHPLLSAPDKVITNIISDFGISDLKTIALVCKRFKAISGSSSAWKIKVEKETNLQNKFIKFMPSLKNLLKSFYSPIDQNNKDKFVHLRISNLYLAMKISSDVIENYSLVSENPLIVTNIFSFLNKSDLNKVALVCKRFRELAEISWKVYVDQEKKLLNLSLEFLKVIFEAAGQIFPCKDVTAFSDKSSKQQYFALTQLNKNLRPLIGKLLQAITIAVIDRTVFRVVPRY